MLPGIVNDKGEIVGGSIDGIFQVDRLVPRASCHLCSENIKPAHSYMAFRRKVKCAICTSIREHFIIGCIYFAAEVCGGLPFLVIFVPTTHPDVVSALPAGH